MKLLTSLLICLFLSSCLMGSYSYEAFKFYADGNIGLNVSPKGWNWSKKNREIYNEIYYIYKSENIWKKGCFYGFLTNRNGKDEVVQDWVILSGKEYCKKQYRYGL